MLSMDFIVGSWIAIVGWIFVLVCVLIVGTWYVIRAIQFSIIRPTLCAWNEKAIHVLRRKCKDVVLKWRNESPLAVRIERGDIDAILGESLFLNLEGAPGRTHIVEAGDPHGPLMVLLHGFPECWVSYLQLIPYLVARGYHVIIPDLRGYNLTECSTRLQDVQLVNIVEDVRQIISHFHAKSGCKAILVGHDFGGAVCWFFAMKYGHLLERMVICNSPHPHAFRRELRSNPDQRAKSAYMKFFVIPFLPELWLSRWPNDTLVDLLDNSARRPSPFLQIQHKVNVSSAAQPGALTKMLNWYRAMYRLKPGVDLSSIQVPVLVLWGARDTFMSVRLTEDLQDWVPNYRVILYENCTHWVPSEEPERMSEDIHEFCSSPSIHS